MYLYVTLLCAATRYFYFNGHLHVLCICFSIQDASLYLRLYAVYKLLGMDTMLQQ